MSFLFPAAVALYDSIIVGFPTPSLYAKLYEIVKKIVICEVIFLPLSEGIYISKVVLISLGAVLRLFSKVIPFNWVNGTSFGKIKTKIVASNIKRTGKLMVEEV